MSASRTPPPPPGLVLKSQTVTTEAAFYGAKDPVETGSEASLSPSLRNLSLGDSEDRFSKEATELGGISAPQVVSEFDAIAGSLIQRKEALQEFLTSERVYVTNVALLKGVYAPLSRGLPPTFESLSASRSFIKPSVQTTDLTGSPSTLVNSLSSRFSIQSASSFSLTPTLLNPDGESHQWEELEISQKLAGLPMDQDASQVIFANVDELSTFLEMFLARLSESIAAEIEDKGTEGRIGSVFLEMLPLMGLLYKSYIAHLPSALNCLQSLHPSAALTIYLDFGRRLASPYVNPCDISTLLLKPAQRLLDYPQMLADLYEATPGNHTDRLSLEKAKEKMEDMVNQLEREALALTSRNNRQSLQSLLAPTIRTTQRVRASRGAYSFVSFDAASMIWNASTADIPAMPDDKIDGRPLSAISESSSLTFSPEMERNRLLQDLMESERKYVRDLEAMQEYASMLRIKEILDQDTIHYLFLNLNHVLTFQNEFLILLESIYARRWEDQQWGWAFTSKEEYFRVYEPYCAHYANAVEVLRVETPHLLRFADASAINPRTELPAFLIKPVQRICYYLPILESLAKLAPTSGYPHLDELNNGASALKRILSQIDQAQRQVENEKAVKSFAARVEDWKGHHIENFGNLILDDICHVTKSDITREYHAFLFEKILILCMEAVVPPAKKKGGLGSILKRTSSVTVEKTSLAIATSLAARKKTTPLLLKGRIFLNNVTRAQFIEKKGERVVQVWWRGDDDLEFFHILFYSRERTKQWEEALNKLLKEQTGRRVKKLPNLPTLQGLPRAGRTLRSGLSAEASSVPRLAEVRKRAVSPPFSDLPRQTNATTPPMQQTGSSSKAPISQPLGALPDLIRLKVYYKEDLFAISADRSISYVELVGRVERKVRLCAGTSNIGSLKLQFEDEDGDRISLTSDEDVRFAFESSNIKLFATVLQ